MRILKKNILSNCCAFFLIHFLIFISVSLTWAETDAGPGVTVLIYHRFDENRYPTTNVSSQRFREQLDYLKTNHYKILPLRDLVQAIKHGTRLPDKAVVITIDDGYRSVYEVAWPILRSYGFPFTVFLYVKGVDSGSHAYMSWDQVREVAEQGGDFQDHSYSHNRMADRPVGMNEADYRAWIREDLRTGRRILEKNLGVQPGFFAIPYGEYNAIVLEETKRLGYEAVLSQDPGSISLETDRYCIPREPILGNEWSTMKHFVEVLNRIDMPIKNMEPSPGEIQGPMVKRFSATLIHPENYEPQTFGIYVTDIGWKKAVLNGNLLSISNDQPLTHHKNRVLVSGRDKKSGRLAVRSWMLLPPQQ